MARLEDRLAENADGDLFVDRSCIDCAICRIVAPHTFARSARAGSSFVARQPVDAGDLLRARMALVSCPTSSIGTRAKPALDEAIDALPEPLGDGIYFCGFAAESSYGAQSYLVVRDGGNVLVDSPRAAPRLLERIEALGGARTMLLTHRDDVADHARIAARLGCTRILHARDVTAATRDVERRIEGDEPVRLADDLVVIPVPGHTAGSAALLYRDLALFSGDHLFATEPSEGPPRLYASRSVCWHSWEEQRASLERLLAWDFRWVLPGHAGRLRVDTTAEMRALLREAIGR